MMTEGLFRTPMKKRNSYHSAIKMAFALDIHKQWLPNEFLVQIPRSTSHAWKHESKEKHLGHEYASQIKDNIGDLKILMNEHASRERRMFIAMIKMKIKIVEIVGKDTLKNTLRDKFREVVTLVENHKQSFNGGTKSICTFLDIKPRTFHYWKSISNYVCFKSPLNICLKKVPNQASEKEIKTIKRLLTNKRLAHWPIRSVQAFALRRKLVALSVSSWYRYNTKFKFREKRKKGRFKKKYTPIRAPRPNHTWHADISHTRTEDGNRYYMYLIVDNYSKHIINWKLHDRISAELRRQTIEEALKQEFGVTPPSNTSLDLIVDGGTENNNTLVDSFIKNSPITIHKKIALKQIEQSNSMVEASNSIIKHRYLYLNPSANFQALYKNIEMAVYDFCFLRPHYGLNAKTPFEAHIRKRINLNPKFTKNAVKERITSNKSNGCGLNCG